LPVNQLVYTYFEVPLHEVVEVQTSTTAPLGIPSPFLLQTGLEQALGFASFHPMSPSTSSSSSSRVAGDDWTNDDQDFTSTLTSRAGRCDHGTRPSTIQTPDTWIGGAGAETCAGRVGYDERAFSGAGEATTQQAGVLPASQPEAVFFEELPVPFSHDGDLRYQSSSFIVSEEDNWDSGYQREEQVVDVSDAVFTWF